jgi:hypothetical protein
VLLAHDEPLHAAKTAVEAEEKDDLSSEDLARQAVHKKEARKVGQAKHLRTDMQK